VNETRHYLEKVYGRGLVGMLNSQGRPTRERLSWAKTRLGENNWISVGGIEIDADVGISWFYGFT